MQIHDYKTSRRLPPQSAMDADRQLAIYELGVRRLFPETRTVTLVWHYLRFDREIRSQRTAARLERVREEMLLKAEDILRAIARGEFPARVSRLCDWCDYRQLCPAINRGRAA